MNEQLEKLRVDIAKRQSRKTALEKEKTNLARNLENESILKQGRALDVAKKHEEKSDGSFVDFVLQSKAQPTEALKQNIEKLDLAIASEDALIREAGKQQKALRKADDMASRTESAKEIFIQLDALIDFQRKAQIAFMELKKSVRLHSSAIEDWDAMAQKLNRHHVYGITLNSILTPGNLDWLSFDQFIERLHELTRPGLGGYGKIPPAIMPIFEGVIQSPVPIDRAFNERSNPSGLTILHNDDAAKNKLQEIWRR